MWMSAVGHMVHVRVTAASTFRARSVVSVDQATRFTISKSCEDNDECRNYPSRQCAQECENPLGSYRCSCHAGFRLASDGRNCEDVNECESNSCSQECENIYGSYQCYCRRGFQLSNTDGVTCEDIDECTLTSGGKVCSYRCVNTPGSYECTCPPTGYTLSPNRRSCLDIDECAAGTHNCSTTQSCFNIQGGFRWLKFDCPPNSRHAAESSPSWTVMWTGSSSSEKRPTGRWML